MVVNTTDKNKLNANRQSIVLLSPTIIELCCDILLIEVNNRMGFRPISPAKNRPQLSTNFPLFHVLIRYSEIGVHQLGTPECFISRSLSTSGRIGEP